MLVVFFIKDDCSIEYFLFYYITRFYNEMTRITFFINVIDNSYIDIEIYDEDIMEFKIMVFYFDFLVIQALFL